MGKNKSPANCTPSSGKGKQKATDTTPSPSPAQDQDWVLCEPISTQTPKRDRYWTDVVVWDLDDVRNLREILTMWVIMGVTASNIGEFLESVLYNRDEHLDSRLTQMTNNQEPHINIALALLKHYQIRDEENKPLWEIKDSQLGDKTSCSGKHRPESSEPSEPSSSSKKARPKRPRISIPNIFRTPSRTEATKREQPQTPTPKRNSWYQVPAPKPLRPFKKPYFLHDERSREIESANDVSGGTVCWSFNIREDLTMLTIAERRALMANTGALPPSFAAEIIDPASAIKRK
ncbi:hypothetical protein N7490_008743 [Penicillium lividum]|nr:hypothetical protein N7490_008743 [Penicillium lividum]